MDSTGKYVASAGDRQIRVFHNVAGKFLRFVFLRSFVLCLGLKALIDDLTEKAHAAKQLTLKERIEEQIHDARFVHFSIFFSILKFVFVLDQRSKKFFMQQQRHRRNRTFYCFFSLLLLTLLE